MNYIVSCKTLSLTRVNIEFISSGHLVISLLLCGHTDVGTNNNEKSGNDIINIIGSEDMENTLLRFTKCSFNSYEFYELVLYFPLKHLPV